MKDNTKKLIGLRINSALATADVKQKDLAAILGVKDNIVSYFVSGTRTPNLEQIVEISNVLNVSTDYLLGKVKDPTPDMDLLSFCEYTGLSSTSIEKVRRVRGDTTLLNLVLSDDLFYATLMIIRDMVQLDFLDSVDGTSEKRNLEFGITSHTGEVGEMLNSLLQETIGHNFNVDFINAALRNYLSGSFMHLADSVHNAYLNELKSELVSELAKTEAE